jgi:hypothetical protein
MGNYKVGQSVARRALEKYSDLLMRLPNVVGLGLGIANGRTGGYVIKVYVSKKLSYLSRWRIPNRLVISLPENPKQIVRVPTVIEQIGQVELQDDNYQKVLSR